MALGVCPRPTNTIYTSTSYNSSKQRYETNIKPEYLSKGYLAAKKHQKWSNNFYKFDDEDHENTFQENSGNLEKKAIQEQDIQALAAPRIRQPALPTPTPSEPLIFRETSSQFSFFETQIISNRVNERCCSIEAFYSMNDVSPLMEIDEVKKEKLDDATLVEEMLASVNTLNTISSFKSKSVTSVLNKTKKILLADGVPTPSRSFIANKERILANIENTASKNPTLKRKLGDELKQQTIKVDRLLSSLYKYKSNLENS